MQEVRAREAQQAEEEKARLVNGLKTAAQIEDELLQEDVQRRTLNHQSQGITLFNPPCGRSSNWAQEYWMWVVKSYQ